MHGPYPLFILLGITLALFVWGRWRYDVVALLALIIASLLGIIHRSETFIGFSNIAVITIACVMVISRAITDSGVVNVVVNKIIPITKSPILQVGILSLIAAVLSAFMNNVGALALMMPVAIQSAIRSKRSPTMVLMPLAFGSALGGLCTSIGTPPNLLISAYREQITGHAFTMFDYTPVGTVVAVVGVIFIAIIGWRLLPQRKAATQAEDLFQISDYITEVSVPENSPVPGKTVQEFEHLIEGDFTIVGLIRRKQKRLTVRSNEVLQENDILIIEASHDDLHELMRVGKLNLVADTKISSDMLRSENMGLIEAVLPPNGRMEGRSWQGLRVRSRYAINLLAIARQGLPFRERLHHVQLRGGDVLLLQGETEMLREKTVSLGLLPLLERGVKVGLKTKAFVPIGLFLIAIFLAGLKILPVQIAFAAAVVALLLLNIIPVRRMYESIDWSVVFLLAAMIPLGSALQYTGGTHLIVQYIMELGGHHSPVLILVLVMGVTMTVSDVLNNVATAVIMAPIAVSIANGLGVSSDTFLMGVAIASSCSFLTPIGHQNNTLVMGPGGYKFYDYIRLGLPLEILVMVVGIPMLLWIWPL